MNLLGHFGGALVYLLQKTNVVALYNKYFKDYKDPNAEYVQEVKVPQTIEEYRRMVLEERIKRIRERRRIEQIKSTKLLFESNNNGYSSSNISNNKPFKHNRMYNNKIA